MIRWLALVLAVVCVAGTGEAAPSKRKGTRKAPHSSKRIDRPADPTATPAYTYGQLDQDTCEAELTSRGIAFQRETAKGVKAPVRMQGPLHGVTFRTDLSDAERATTPWEIADCRLVLALDDFAQILARHDIVEVRHYSMHRVAPTSWPDGKLSLQHIGGVAIDAGRFIDKDGHVLDVEDHFSGRIGAKTCGPGARPRKKTPESTRLREILCEAVDARLFNIVLTPNYNRPHRNHFHLEITGATWFLVH